MRKIKVVSKSGEETEKEQGGVYMQRGYLQFETFAAIRRRRLRVNQILKQKYA